MPRLGYVNDDGEIGTAIKARRGGELTPLDGLLLHSPPLAAAWNHLFKVVRTQTTIPADIRELVILRVAMLNAADYEWAAHEPIAREAGLTNEQLAGLREHAISAVFDARQTVVLNYTDRMTVNVKVSDDEFVKLEDSFDERQIVELTATIASYNLVSRFLVAMELTEADRGRLG